MNETPFEGSVSSLRTSDFIDATIDLAGRSKENAIETEIDAMVNADGLINGTMAKGQFAARLKIGTRRLLMNATKRKIMVVATGSNVPAKWAGLKIRLYQTFASDRATSGKTACRAVAVDCFDAKRVVWLDYFDFQPPKCQAHVRRMREEESK